MLFQVVKDYVLNMIFKEKREQERHGHIWGLDQYRATKKLEECWCFTNLFEVLRKDHEWEWEQIANILAEILLVKARDITAMAYAIAQNEPGLWCGEHN